MRAATGVVTVVYSESLVLANNERFNEHSRAPEDIVNLMSVDATRLQDFCTYGLMAISGPHIKLCFSFQLNCPGYSGLYLLA